MAHITSIAPQADWDKARKERRVVVQTTPGKTLEILNYADSVQYDCTWDAVTLASRGLILNTDGTIVARPFTKFFNYGEPSPYADKDFTGPISVTDKMDGSLGILYFDPETQRERIATRGSFASHQALHATEVYQDKYEGKWEPETGYTYLFEIVYPENTIVVNYQGEDDLYLIGKVNIETGVSVPIDGATEWKWKKAETFDFDNLADVLGAEQVANKEGFVIHFTDSDHRLKIKFEDYVRLHRIVTNLTSKRVWEALKEGADIEAYRKTLEEEFLDFFDSKVELYRSQHKALIVEARELYDSILKETQGDRKAFAQLVGRSQLSQAQKGFLFKWLDLRGALNNLGLARSIEMEALYRELIDELGLLHRTKAFEKWVADRGLTTEEARLIGALKGLNIALYKLWNDIEPEHETFRF